SDGQIVADHIDPADYQIYIGETVEDDSYLKSPYYKPLGYPAGLYRVGPLARISVCNHMGVPLADHELKEFRYRFHGTATSSFLYHYARLIEILAALELIDRLIDDPDITFDHLRAVAGINRLEGIGASEAPRGTLFHHYKIDRHGLIKYVNLVIATGQNNLAMNQTMLQIARHYIHGPEIPEGVLNRMEAGIRAFDPCLSCSTHALGMMPLHVQLLAADGSVRSERWRH
ncbi:MAG: nickel-dependent hydrogenase large subunit, partial [Alphaproteobacteria bacterium]|nr:nickel-dependent hydrogenase large subunit [Alphaproteobacteria bacterium]